MARFGLPTVLFLIFLVLKLTKQIDWSWIWITAPLWGVALIWILVLIVFLLIAITTDKDK